MRDIRDVFCVCFNIAFSDRKQIGNKWGFYRKNIVVHEIIAGTFIVVGIDENGNFKSLTDEQLLRYSNRFKEIEQYTDEDVNEAYWYELTCFLRD